MIMVIVMLAIMTYESCNCNGDRTIDIRNYDIDNKKCYSDHDNGNCDVNDDNFRMVCDNCHVS